MKQTITYTYDERSKVIDVLKCKMSERSVFAFKGTLGAGKTTLIRDLLRSCGVIDEIFSPTFTYLNIYQATSNGFSYNFYHFDLYRLKDASEFFAAGFEEYLYQPNSWALIEWPELIMPYIKKDCCVVTLIHDDHDQRIVIIE